MIKAVFLDFGDTLISEQIFIAEGRDAAIRFLAAHFGWAISHDDLQKRFHLLEAELWERWNGRPPAVKEEAIRLAAFEQLIRENGNQPTRAAVEGALHHLVLGAATSACLLDGAAECLSALARDFRLAIVSNGLDAYTRLCLEHHGLMRYFAAYTISEQVNVEKPDPRILQLTMAQMNLRPEEVVMVGNRADVDLLCANRAGCRSVWYRHPGSPEHPGARPDMVITSLKELPAYCRSLNDSPQAAREET